VYAAARQVQPLVSVVAAPAERPGAESPADDGLRARLRTAHPSERLHLLDDGVRAITAQVLRMPPRRIDPDRPFGALGVDSLMAIEIRNRIEAETGVALSATVIWNHPTVTELAAHVLTRLDADAGGPQPESAAEPVTGEPRAATTVDQIVAASETLVDDDVLRLLMGGDS
jgi:acyl carrier protein